MNDASFEKSQRNKVKRLPQRGYYDKETIYGILDAHFICHLSWEKDGQPFIIPTAFGRKDDTIYIHGSSKSRMLEDLSDGRPLCMVVTHFDGLVLARSAFHHSMNYRSAVIYGIAHEVHGEEKMEALRIVSDQILPGRWNEVRFPNDSEMKATTVLAVDIETASAKIRTGPPKDDAEDYDLPIWAGILPATISYHEPITDPSMKQDLPISESVYSRLKKENLHDGQ